MYLLSVHGYKVLNVSSPGLPGDGGALPARVCGQWRGADDGGDRRHPVPPLPLRGHQAADTRVSP